MAAKRVLFHTLGCKLNFSESSTLARRFAEGGYERARSAADADVCVVNTCSVTEHADKKCRNLIRRLHRENPEAIIAVTGCYAQLDPDGAAAIEGVDMVLGNNEKGGLFERVSALSEKGRASVHSCSAGELTSFFAAFSSGDRTRSFLKVQDGCDYRCSYCTIPDARGASRNIPVEKITGQAWEIARSGGREIVITGINTGDFGRTTGESFPDLLTALDSVEGIERYRISSIEPNLLTDEILTLCAASGKFQPHFHIPLQSGCDRILALMRRRYDTAGFRGRIEVLRSLMPDAFIGMDVIVGFPGETEAEFEATYRFLESMEPAFLHIFPYSARPGTDAARYPGKVAPAVKSLRARRLAELSGRLHRRFAERHIGTEADVLFESARRDGAISGFTGNYLRVSVPFDMRLANTVRRVRLTGIGAGNEITGRLSEFR